MLSHVLHWRAIHAEGGEGLIIGTTALLQPLLLLEISQCILCLATEHAIGLPSFEPALIQLLLNLANLI